MSVLMISANRYKPAVSPLGLEYVCSGLARERIGFHAVDLNFETEKELFLRLQSQDIAFVGISLRNVDAHNLLCNDYFLPACKRLIAGIKGAKECYVVLGGAGYSHFPEQILDYTGADFGVVGYGERAFPALVRTFYRGEDFTGIPNLVWKDSRGIQVNPSSMEGYDTLPARRRDIFRNADYFARGGSGNVETKRGCDRHCGYCSEPVINGREVVYRNPCGVVDEIEALRARGITRVFFCDSEFNIGDEAHGARLCEELVRRRTGVSWSANFRPDGTISQSFLRLMHEAGCTEAWVSADSGSDELLAAMNKGHSVEDTIMMAERIKKEGIRLAFSHLIGWPGESERTIDETARLVKRCAPHCAMVYAGVRINPGTRIARIARSHGMYASDRELMAPVFWNREQVLEEFLPLIRKKFRDIPNCVLPDRSGVLYHLKMHLVESAFASGFNGGMTELQEYYKRLPLMKKIRLIGRAGLGIVGME